MHRPIFLFSYFAFAEVILEAGNSPGLAESRENAAVSIRDLVFANHQLERIAAWQGSQFLRRKEKIRREASAHVVEVAETGTSLIFQSVSTITHTKHTTPPPIVCTCPTTAEADMDTGDTGDTTPPTIVCTGPPTTEDIDTGDTTPTPIVCTGPPTTEDIDTGDTTPTPIVCTGPPTTEDIDTGDTTPPTIVCSGPPTTKDTTTTSIVCTCPPTTEADVDTEDTTPTPVVCTGPPTTEGDVDTEDTTPTPVVCTGPPTTEDVDTQETAPRSTA